MINPKPYRECLSLSNKLHRLWWNVCCLIFFRPFPGPIFKKWRIFVLKCFGAKIGHGCAVNSSTKIWAPWHLETGQYTAIGSEARIYNPGKIKLGSKCVISQGAYLCTASHDVTNPLNPLITAPIVIEDQAWVAAEAFVGMGVTIGQGAVVGARAAVFKDVEPWTIVGGNPARPIKKRVLSNG